MYIVDIPCWCVKLRATCDNVEFKLLMSLTPRNASKSGRPPSAGIVITMATAQRLKPTVLFNPQSDSGAVCPYALQSVPAVMKPGIDFRLPPTIGPCTPLATDAK